MLVQLKVMMVVLVAVVCIMVELVGEVTYPSLHHLKAMLEGQL